MVGGGGCQWGTCRQRWNKTLNMVSTAAKSKRLAAAVQSASLRPFFWGGGTPSQYGMGGSAGSKPMSFSSTNTTPTQGAPQPLRPHTDYSVNVCFRCGKPGQFVNFCPK